MNQHFETYEFSEACMTQVPLCMGPFLSNPVHVLIKPFEILPRVILKRVIPSTLADVHVPLEQRYQIISLILKNINLKFDV